METTTTLVVSFTDPSLANKTYTIKTASSSELILYGVDPLPEVTTVQMDKQNYSSADNRINLTWTGNDKMSDLEKLDIYILENPDSEENGVKQH